MKMMKVDADVLEPHDEVRRDGKVYTVLDTWPSIYDGGKPASMWVELWKNGLPARVVLCKLDDPFQLILRDK